MKLPVRIDHRVIYDADGNTIAMIAPTDEAAAYAAYIVDTVNSHAGTLSRAYRRGYYDGLEEGREE